jgi:hypothetical protein
MVGNPIDMFHAGKCPSGVQVGNPAATHHPAFEAIFLKESYKCAATRIAWESVPTQPDVGPHQQLGVETRMTFLNCHPARLSSIMIVSENR